MHQLISIIILLAICIFCLLLFIPVSYRAWVKRFGVEIPIDIPAPVRNVRKHFQRRAMVFMTRDYNLMMENFMRLFKPLKPDYWIKYCGLDAYIYLYFQRSLFKLMVYMSILSLVVSIPLNVISSSLQEGENIYTGADGGADEDETTQKQWFVRTTICNKTLTTFSSWGHVFLVFIFSWLVIRTVLLIQSHVKQMYIKDLSDKSQKRNTEWLKSRTAHIRGLPPNDRKGVLLGNMLSNFLKEYGGKVMGLIVPPDFQRLFELEVKRKELDDISSMLQARQKHCSRMFIPKKYKDQIACNRLRDEIDAKIQTETEKPYYSAGHAFVCFDSLRSMSRCLIEFERLTPLGAVQTCLFTIKDKIGACFHKRRFRSTSTFGKFVDVDVEAELTESPEREMAIIARRASEPMDINWKSMGGMRGHYFLRRLLFNLVAVVILIFLSTPTAAFGALKSISLLEFFDFEWAKSLPMGGIVRTYCPPLIILLINLLLLTLIDLGSYYSKHYTFSEYQYSLFAKTFIYLLLNMLIIPALTLATSNSLFDVFVNKDFNLAQILGEMYFPDSGHFFVTLLLQSATCSTIFYMLRGNEIINNYFSAWLAHYRRKYMNDQEPWRRNERVIFSYGTFYAQILAVFAITIVFSSTIPLITFAGAFFFGTKHYVDGFNLLTVHLKEMESSTGLTKRVLSTALFCVLLYQAGMFCFFFLNSNSIECLVIGTMFVGTLILTIVKNEELFDILSLETYHLFNEKDMGSHTQITDKHINQWRKEYSHPLDVRRHFEGTDLVEVSIGGVAGGSGAGLGISRQDVDNGGGGLIGQEGEFLSGEALIADPNLVDSNRYQPFDEEHENPQLFDTMAKRMSLGGRRIFEKQLTFSDKKFTSPQEADLDLEKISAITSEVDISKDLSQILHEEEKP